MAGDRAPGRNDSAAVIAFSFIRTIVRQRLLHNDTFKAVLIARFHIH